MDKYSKANNPDMGARIVFFSGGTALRELSREIIKYTYNSVHLITAFDSGGSSAALRKSFGILAVGDIRNRLLALADLNVVPKSVIDICNMRLPSFESKSALINLLHNINSESYPIWYDIPEFLGDAIRFYLSYFLKNMPEDFDPNYASIGNLILVGAFIYHNKSIENSIEFFSHLLCVRGLVLPIVGDNLHLVARVNDKSYIFGQHNITAKEKSALIRTMWGLYLTKNIPYTLDKKHMSSALNFRINNDIMPLDFGDLALCKPILSGKIIAHISSADLICYPMGSFYTSIISNFLPAKVGQTIAQAKCHKIYIPNIGYDSEQDNMSVAQSVQIILKYLRKDAGEHVLANKLLNKVIVDSKNGLYSGGIDFEGLKSLGIEVSDVPLIKRKEQVHDPKLTLKALWACV